MNISKGPFTFFTDPGYFVVGLYGDHRQLYVQRSEYYLNIGLLTRLTGDLLIHRKGEPWDASFRDYSDRAFQAMRWTGRRWAVDWRSYAEIEQIEAENKARSKKFSDPA